MHRLHQDSGKFEFYTVFVTNMVNIISPLVKMLSYSWNVKHCFSNSKYSSLKFRLHQDSGKFEIYTVLVTNPVKNYSGKKVDILVAHPVLSGVGGRSWCCWLVEGGHVHPICVPNHDQDSSPVRPETLWRWRITCRKVFFLLLPFFHPFRSPGGSYDGFKGKVKIGQDFGILDFERFFGHESEIYMV